VPIKGNGKAKIAAERKLLSVIYVMLKEKSPLIGISR